VIIALAGNYTYSPQILLAWQIIHLGVTVRTPADLQGVVYVKTQMVVDVELKTL
jgi:hypothetical protein